MWLMTLYEDFPMLNVFLQATEGMFGFWLMHMAALHDGSCVFLVLYYLAKQSHCEEVSCCLVALAFMTWQWLASLSTSHASASLLPLGLNRPWEVPTLVPWFTQPGQQDWQLQAADEACGHLWAHLSCCDLCRGCHCRCLRFWLPQVRSCNSAMRWTQYPVNTLTNQELRAGLSFCSLTALECSSFRQFSPDAPWDWAFSSVCYEYAIEMTLLSMTYSSLYFTSVFRDFSFNNLGGVSI